MSKEVEVIHVRAWKVMKPRIFGDIGLRAFIFLYREARKIMKDRNIDFIWIPVPSYYTALLGRLLHYKTHVPYGIDYIDPWVRNVFARKNFANIVSGLLASILEPIAIRRASLVTGVAELYYMPALHRNFKEEQVISIEDQRAAKPSFEGSIFHTAFPYGFDPRDHALQINKMEYPWNNIPNCKPLVYTGAFMPNSRLFIDVLFMTIRQLSDEKKWNNDVHLFFLGTGYYSGKSISDHAEAWGIGAFVHEVRTRYPFLSTLNLQSKSLGVMVIGSTERHYTASKLFQALKSRQPVLAILNEDSSAFSLLREVKADQYTISWNESITDQNLSTNIREKLIEITENNEWSPDYETFEQKYSSRESARKLVAGMELSITARKDTE